MYFGESYETLNGKMPLLHWMVLSGTAILMVIGIINLYGLEIPSYIAAVSILN